MWLSRESLEVLVVWILALGATENCMDSSLDGRLCGEKPHKVLSTNLLASTELNGVTYKTHLRKTCRTHMCRVETCDRGDICHTGE